MDPARVVDEAIHEAKLDVEQGADMVMVKPAGAYLDVIAAVRQSMHVPMVAYQVSGEYAMLEAASRNGWLDGDRAVLESLLAIKRAGADLIITYYAERLAKLLPIRESTPPPAAVTAGSLSRLMRLTLLVLDEP